MDWNLALERNSEALRRIVSALFVLAGLVEGAVAARLPRGVYFSVLSVLRPAESAVRRLIVIAARGLVLKPGPARSFPVGLSFERRPGEMRTRAFCLIDPLKPLAPGMLAQDDLDDGDSDLQGLDRDDLGRDDAGHDDPGLYGWDDELDHDDPDLDGVEHDNRGSVAGLPRISLPGVFDPVFRLAPPVPSADDAVSALSICHRLNALWRALDDLPRQARRLARWRARRDLALGLGGPRAPRRMSPFRPGPPPGFRRRPIHAVDAVLSDCHYFAIEAFNAPNTS